MSNKILIIGYGRVGKEAYKLFAKRYTTYIYDPFINPVDFPDCKFVDNLEQNFDLSVICIPTPIDLNCYVKVSFTSGYKFKIYASDVSGIIDVVARIKSKHILIKSTVPPGTSAHLAKLFSKSICFSPEYISDSSYDTEFKFMNNMEATPMFIVGGEYATCKYVLDLVQPIIGPQKHLYYANDAVNAEIIKYMENDYFSKKVVFANESRNITEKLGGYWYCVYEGWKLDPRVEAMHTAVFPQSPGFGGKCLPKDVMARCFCAIVHGNYLPYFSLASLIQNTIYQPEAMFNQAIKDFVQISKIESFELVEGNKISKLNPEIR